MPHWRALYGIVFYMIEALARLEERARFAVFSSNVAENLYLRYARPEKLLFDARVHLNFAKLLRQTY